MIIVQGTIGKRLGILLDISRFSTLLNFAKELGFIAVRVRIRIIEPPLELLGQVEIYFFSQNMNPWLFSPKLKRWFHDNKRDAVFCFLSTLPSSGCGFYPPAHRTTVVPKASHPCPRQKEERMKIRSLLRNLAFKWEKNSFPLISIK